MGSRVASLPMSLQPSDGVITPVEDVLDEQSSVETVSSPCVVSLASVSLA